MKPAWEAVIMESIEDSEKWKESIEGIDYDLWLFGDVQVEDLKYRMLIIKALQLLPKHTRKKVLDEVTFIMMSEGTFGHFFQMNVKEIVLLNIILLIKGRCSIFLYI